MTTKSRVLLTFVMVAIAAAVFFLEPLAVTVAVYDRTMNLAGQGNSEQWIPNPGYNSTFHYGYYFPVEFEFARQAFNDDNCSMEGQRRHFGSIIGFKCSDDGEWKYGWAWYYVFRQAGIQIRAGNPVFVDVFMGYKYLFVQGLRALGL